jgi:hypothetical protein
VSQWPKDTEQDLIDFYGNPGPEVEAQLVDVVPPFVMRFEGKPIKAIKFHRKAAPALKAALDDIWTAYGKDQSKVDAAKASVFDGSYNPRKIAGSNRWSNHAFGAAIDIDAADNGFNTGHGTIPQLVVDAFKRQGARWGGDYHGRTDPMHLEFCGGGESVSKPGDVPDHPPPLSVYPPTLKLGSKGDDVRRVQQLLMVDGIFGDLTRIAVTDFQHDKGLATDGIVGPETWQALLKIAPLPTPVVPPAVPPSLHLTGKCSWFGGPLDTGVSPSEDLAFIYSVGDQPSIFLPEQPPGTTGLARRLDPAKFFIACRWSYDKPYQSKADLLKHRARVRALKTGKEADCWPADWGPNEATGRIADLSHGLMTSLGITTDDEVEVVYPSDIPSIVAKPTPSVPVPAPADWRDFDIWGWLKSMFFSNQGK